MYTTSLLSKNLPPLAERIRPQILSDFTGQKNIVKSKSLLYQSIKSNQPFSIIFWGPPGSGKTTSAQMLGRNHDYNVYEADCYIAFKNPLVDPNDKHPFFSMAKKKPMKVIFGSKTSFF